MNCWSNLKWKLKYYLIELKKSAKCVAKSSWVDFRINNIKSTNEKKTNNIENEL